MTQPWRARLWRRCWKRIRITRCSWRVWALLIALPIQIAHSTTTNAPPTIEPANADYATGYSSALVQARRFAEAAAILRKVIAAAPNNYAAHANLATALV